MNMYKNGVLVSSGHGRDCMNSPLNALEWLAKQMLEVGQPLRSGEIILSGSLGKFVDIQAGDHIHSEIDGLGDVNVYIQ